MMGGKLYLIVLLLDLSSLPLTLTFPRPESRIDNYGRIMGRREDPESEYMELAKKNTDDTMEGETNEERAAVSGGKVDIEGYFISDPDPNSKATDLIESMLIERVGETVPHQPEGIESIISEKMKTKEEFMDHDILLKDYKSPQKKNDKREKKDDELIRSRKNFYPFRSMLWERGIVPYEIQPPLSTDSKYRQIIDTAIEEFRNLTCINFVPRDSALAKSLESSTYVSFEGSSGGCWSYVGKVPWEIQPINIETPGCVSVSTTIHEMCHAIGQAHEQSRNDRDKYVTLFWDNVSGGTSNGNMAKHDTVDRNAYDVSSVLQYSLTSLSNNGKPTMEFKDPRLNFLADSATGLSFYDVKDITAGYDCAGHCSNKPTCLNGGFVNHRCVCYCPRGLTGANCETLITDNDCGGFVTLASFGSQNITTPNYPNHYPLGKICTWLIQAPKGQFIRMTTNDFDLTGSTACDHWLEVRYNLMGQTGPRLCGVPHNEKFITSKDEFSNKMLLTFDSATDGGNNTASKGFLINVAAIGEACQPAPCKFGTCSSTDNTTFTCTCWPGFKGDVCDTFNGNVTCNFEQGSSCIMRNNASKGEFTWNTRSGRTPSSGTGPSSAHGGSHYLYMETSFPRQEGDKAVYETFAKLTPADRCLSFWYHMYGATMGTLNVLVNGDKKWTREGDQGDEWFHASISLPSSPNLVVSFEGIRKGWRGDTAIDDITITSGLCE